MSICICEVKRAHMKKLHATKWIYLKVVRFCWESETACLPTETHSAIWQVGRAMQNGQLLHDSVNESDM